ncbi:MAG: ribonuclease Y [Thermodesulfobacteriota bacterium]
MTNWQAGLLGFVIAAVAALVLFLARRRQLAAIAREAGEARERILADARREAETLRREAQVQAKDELLRSRAEFEQESREQRANLQSSEKRLASQSLEIERQVAKLETRSGELDRRDTGLREKERQAEELRASLQVSLEEARRSLERAAGLSRDEARKALLDEITAESRHEAAKRIRQIEEEAHADAERRAKKVVAVAIERLAGEFVAERTISIVHLPTDDMKGRLIGREGRNIRAIEAATGVDLIIDDTPETVVISCHNPVRREIARTAVEKLVSDGRIHPGRIEELVRKAEQEVEETVREAGQKALFEVGVHGVHPEIIKLLGMLKYRYSYGQNVLAHSIEAAFICGVMASELGLNPKHARRAALLHDIGKSLTHEVEGSHALIGADIARKYGESAKICNAIAAHHEEVRAETLLAPLVDAADALSGARPGARREVLESYVRRLEDLERISNSFNGVEKSFAVQAGREIRIFVEPSRINDDEAVVLARDVARKIENEMTYPGQIKVTVIRETRASELAR